MIPVRSRALLLDVDGVLIPYGAPSPEWGDLVRHPSLEDVVVSRQLFTALATLDADMHWLTSWGKTANSILCPLIDWPPLPVLKERTVREWWKLIAVEEFLATAPQSRVAWIDDDLDQYAEAVEDSLGQMIESGRLLLICPAANVGLTRQQVTELSEHLNPSM